MSPSPLRLSSYLVLTMLAIACGGGQPASEPSPPQPEAPAGAAPASEMQASGESTVEASEPEPELTEEEKLAQAERQREESAPREREVLYKVTPGGLVVEVDGVRFKPTAEPTKKSNGGYGIKITVEAEATDDDTHVLLSPEHGPLSFAVTIFDKKGNEQARHGDVRNGDEQQFIMPGGPLKLSREWPSGAVKGPLWWRQKVTLHVGLWGLGRATEKGRPLQKFFIVEMVGGSKAQAVITPPIID